LVVVVKELVSVLKRLLVAPRRSVDEHAPLAFEQRLQVSSTNGALPDVGGAQ
jgi:hypothetical protein